MGERWQDRELRLMKRLAEQDAHIKELKEALAGVVEAAVTGEDCCPLCEGDLASQTPHIFGCQVGYAVTLLAREGDALVCSRCGGSWPCHSGCVSGDPLARKGDDRG